MSAGLLAVSFLASCWGDTVRVEEPTRQGSEYVDWSADVLSRVVDGYLMPKVKVTIRRRTDLTLVRYVTVMCYRYGYDYDRAVTIDLSSQQLETLNTGAPVELVFEFEKTAVFHPTEETSHLLPIAEDEEYVSGQDREIWYRRPSAEARR